MERIIFGIFPNVGKVYEQFKAFFSLKVWPMSYNHALLQSQNTVRVGVGDDSLLSKETLLYDKGNSCQILPILSIIGFG